MLNRMVWMGEIGQEFNVDIIRDLRSQLTVFVGHELVPSFYWQLVDPDFSLLEIGVDRESGRLTKISVPLYNGPIGVREGHLRQEDKKGLPCFNVNLWPRPSASMKDAFLENIGRIRIDVIDSEWWFITLFDDPRVFSSRSGNSLWFGFNGRNELVQLAVNTKDARTTIG